MSSHADVARKPIPNVRARPSGRTGTLPSFLLKPAGRLAVATLGFGLAAAGMLAVAGPLPGAEAVPAVLTFLVVVSSIVATGLAVEQAPGFALAMLIVLPFAGGFYLALMLVAASAGPLVGVPLVLAGGAAIGLAIRRAR